ncbi:glycosyltransferase family 9 protein [bacterium]|nr:glycosyltransferase family 9 protein [candidate division CSSED10-310 bacterium]
MDYRFDCRKFNGYKPCSPYKLCENCSDYSPQGFRILIINLDALGDVLMTTALLPSIKAQHPQSTIRWITLPMAVPLLENNPFIDEIIPYSPETLSWLKYMDFDLVLSCDRDRKSTAIAMSVSAQEKRGFGLGPEGVIIPLNQEMEYAYRLGIDDTLKFRTNRQTGQQILSEGMGFSYQRHEYILELTDEERKAISHFREEKGMFGSIQALGINTGCSGKFRYKRLNEDQLHALIKKILARDSNNELRIFLLGGKTETDLNNRLIQQACDQRVIATPTDEGIRKGLLYIAACDACLTGDTFGLHAAIALKIPSIVFFTISCDVEIDLYDRGRMVLADVPCRPCWKPWCPDPICIDQVNLDELTDAAWSILRQLSVS